MAVVENRAAYDDWLKVRYTSERDHKLAEWLLETNEPYMTFGYRWFEGRPSEERNICLRIRRSVQSPPMQDRGRNWEVHVAVDERTGEALVARIKQRR